MSFTLPTRSPPYTAVFTHHFTRVNCISKILCKKFSFIIPKKQNTYPTI
ncbi:2-C-methyl-D-erythritol 4-phosphate cytidylyltransferase [Bacillus cereus]|nr:2-C-methyl-D-erythritol 4-phosphate cytidylyltransferase [Bacillus cereus]PFK32365.1 2-C-methyl-D-erythritol 4-phosphate cytidylyltransferase [Bacillus cereus]PFN02870.1 2-C-methyl-D-erythritol 4-phosphate cytidylyltransferase [Bacillus cereus]PFR19997.1 2-C-methyl-D-erythritol 4-phosphate cytidylyltransferase [Bacillus cereus]